MTTTVSFGQIEISVRDRQCDHDLITEIIDNDIYRIRKTQFDAPVLDLGANIGIFALACAHYGAQQVICVEPEPGNLEVLHENAARCLPLVVVPKAVGAAAGTTHVSGEDVLAHTGSDGTSVEQVTLASLFEDYQLDRVAYLKADMEGAEAPTLLACDPSYLDRCERITVEAHGPDICPWTERPSIGAIIEHLMYTHHHLEVAGDPMGLSMVYAHR